MPRLLFDEPLSEQLCKSLADLFPGALHVRVLGHGGAVDPNVWELAREHSCMIVSKDGDFHPLSGPARRATEVHVGSPGQLRTADVARLLRNRYEDIVRFSEQDEAAVLELG